MKTERACLGRYTVIDAWKAIAKGAQTKFAGAGRVMVMAYGEIEHVSHV